MQLTYTTMNIKRCDYIDINRQSMATTTTQDTPALLPWQYRDASGHVQTYEPVGELLIRTEFAPMTMKEWQDRSHAWGTSSCEVSRFVHDCVNELIDVQQALIDVQQQNVVLTQDVRELRQRVEQLEHQAHVPVSAQ